MEIINIFKKFGGGRNFGRCGVNVMVKRGDFQFKNKIFMGSHIYVGPNSLWYAQGGITVDDGCIFGPNTVIWSANHNIKKYDTVPYSLPDVEKPVHIGIATWVGEGVKIAPGVKIGNCCVIGMGSVVTKNIPDFSIAQGNPAQIIGQRDAEKCIDLISRGRFYLKEKYDLPE